MKRIIIIGCPGSGKSTLARALHATTQLPLHYLDRMYWNADRTFVEKSIFRERLAQVLDTDEWIIDGNYGSTMDMRMKRADTIVLLDFPTDVCLSGIRDRFGKPRPDMPWVETVEDTEFLDYIRTFREQHLPQIYERLTAYSDRNIHIFHTRDEAFAWVESIQKTK